MVAYALHPSKEIICWID